MHHSKSLGSFRRRQQCGRPFWAPLSCQGAPGVVRPFCHARHVGEVLVAKHPQPWLMPRNWLKVSQSEMARGVVDQVRLAVVADCRTEAALTSCSKRPLHCGETVEAEILLQVLLASTFLHMSSQKGLVGPGQKLASKRPFKHDATTAPRSRPRSKTHDQEKQMDSPRLCLTAVGSCA